MAPNANALLRSADAALYSAKENGRTCGIGVISYIFGNLIKDEKIMETLDKQYGFSIRTFINLHQKRCFQACFYEVL